MFWLLFYKKKNCSVSLGGVKDEINLIANAFNNDVEIIEEDKDIEKLNAEIIAKRNYCDALSLDFLKLDLKSMCEKINELIDEINKLKENKWKRFCY